MYNYVGHRWIKTFLRKIISILLVYSLFFTNSANASTLAGGSGWRVASTVANGVGVTVNGVKDIIVNGASKTVTGVANVTPTASQVGKFMGKNFAGAAVIGAMDLLLDGVDYVLDPANNTVTYKKKIDPVNANPWQTHCWSDSGGNGCYSTVDSAANALCKSYGFGSASVYYNNGSMAFANCDGGNPVTITGGKRNPLYDPSVSESEHTKPITVPLSNIGSQVITQAEEELRTGNPAVPIATPVTQAAATAVVGEAATDETQARPIVAELDKSAAIPTTETATGEIAPPTTNPNTGEAKPGSISLDFPVFCSWAPSMCVLSDKVQEAITDAREWAKNDENQDTDNEPPEIEEIDIEALDTSTFTGVAGCPAPITVPITFGDGGETEISYEPICQLAEKWSFVAPMIGFLSGALIIVGVGRKGEDGEI